jgi:hypothetical protein
MGQNSDPTLTRLFQFYAQCRDSLKNIKGIPKDTSKVDEAIVDQLQRLFILGLNEQHFDLTMGHLVLTLESFCANRVMVVEVARNLIPLRTAFVYGAKKAWSRQAGARFSLSL